MDLEILGCIGLGELANAVGSIIRDGGIPLGVGSVEAILYVSQEELRRLDRRWRDRDISKEILPGDATPFSVAIRC